jgi:uncharacterized protein Usg
MSLEMQLSGYRLTTAEITYRRPDHLHLLQDYIWQDMDVAPDFPVLRRFLEFWENNLDGPLHSVRVASVALVKPAEFRLIEGQLRLH